MRRCEPLSNNAARLTELGRQQCADLAATIESLQADALASCQPNCASHEGLPDCWGCLSGAGPRVRSCDVKCE
eukprot:3165609-Amphidinium_carterae.1